MVAVLAAPMIRLMWCKLGLLPYAHLKNERSPMTPKKSMCKWSGLSWPLTAAKLGCFFRFLGINFRRKRQNEQILTKIDTKLKLVHKDSETSIPIASSRLPQCPLLDVAAIILFLKRRRLARPMLQLSATYLGALTWSLNTFLSKGLRW